MKKFVLLFFLFAFTIGVKADETSHYAIVYQYGEEEVVHKLNLRVNNGIKFFEISPLDDYIVLDNTLINNLAYLGNINDDELYLNVIQMLIWQNTVSDLKYFIKDNMGNTVDIANIVNDINSSLEKYNKTSSLAGSYYEVDFGAMINLTDQINLRNYQNDLFSSENYGSYIKLYLNKVGFFEIKFNNYLNIDGSYVFAFSRAYKPFSIYVNVIGQKLEFNVTTPDNLPYNLIFEVYDLEDNYLDTISIDENNLVFYYEKGIDIRLKEVTEYPTFVLESDIIINNDDSLIHSIDICKEALEFDVIIKTKYVKYLYSEGMDTDTDVSIYNSDFKLVGSCKSNSECLVRLKAGKYIFKDNLTNLTYAYDILGEYEIEIDRLLISGIITDHETVIKSNDFILKEKNNIYILEEAIKPGIYTFLVNNESVNLNLANKDDYIYINEYGVFYKLNIEESSVDIMEGTDEETFEDNKVNVGIPNTGLDNYSDWGYVDDKKNLGYSFYCFSTTIAN